MLFLHAMKLRKLIRRMVLCLLLLALTAGAIPFYYYTFVLPEKLFRASLAAAPVDAVIVPGIPYHGGKWGFVMKHRVYWSVFLYKTGRAKNIIYSGGAVYTPYVEAAVMALYAEKMGVPKEHIFIEPKAEHTTENLFYSYQLAQQHGFRTIAFATDPFQSVRITPYISTFKLHVSLIPMVIPLIEKIKMEDFDIASAKAYQLHFVSIEQRETPEQRAFYSNGGRIRIN